MTVIYGYLNDTDTYVLRNIWDGFKNVKVVNAFNKNRDTLTKAISNEKDILIFCGHGSPDGLFGTEGYVLSSKNVEFVKAKYVIGVWCYAKDFAKKFPLRGFFTSMYISNIDEAFLVLPSIGSNRVPTSEEITQSEIKFCKTLNSFIRTRLDEFENWPKLILETIPPENVVEKYNHEALEYVS